MPAAGRQRVERLEPRLAADAGGEQLRGVAGAHERAREDELELDFERLESLDDLLEARDASLVSGRSRSSG